MDCDNQKTLPTAPPYSWSHISTGLRVGGKRGLGRGGPEETEANTDHSFLRSNLKKLYLVGHQHTELMQTHRPCGSCP